MKVIDSKAQVHMETMLVLNQKLDIKLRHTQTRSKTLDETIWEKKRQDWLDKSRDSIEEYNQFVEKHGCYGDKLRCF